MTQHVFVKLTTVLYAACLAAEGSIDIIAEDSRVILFFCGSSGCIIKGDENDVFPHKNELLEIAYTLARIPR